MRRLELQAQSALSVAGDYRLQTPVFRMDTAIKLIPKFSEHQSFLLSCEKIAQLDMFPEDKFAAMLQVHLTGKALKSSLSFRRRLSGLQNIESRFADCICRCTRGLPETPPNSE